MKRLTKQYQGQLSFALAREVRHDLTPDQESALLVVLSDLLIEALGEAPPMARSDLARRRTTRASPQNQNIGEHGRMPLLTSRPVVRQRDSHRPGEQRGRLDNPPTRAPCCQARSTGQCWVI
jgi:hypothetical protein